ncbi:MAG: MBOAT family protein [Clostridiales Family XIII bacterium]|nr:MBOAT family protein [Clostridiales Family XIII bacterium]
MLLIFSLLFYAWGEPVWVFLLVFICVIDYFGAFFIERQTRRVTRKWILLLLIILNLLPLFMFKYFNFLIDNINMRFGADLDAFPFLMPIGISFFTFQAISYLVDVYREKVHAQRNLLYIVLYIAMFPQLMAGPIIRYSDIAKQITQRDEGIQRFSRGMFRFCIGLGKKVILANYAGNTATALLDGQLNNLSVQGAWIGLLMFFFQIYFDFSGYSDMAIGLGRIFGFDYKENFRYPYTARSVTEFWRRWHISLSSFFRDYVYIPMGGNRKHQYLNILIVWALTGLWHGAAWNFILWGLYYALLLVIEKKLRSAGLDISKIPVISNIVLLLIVLLGWGLFYYTDITELGMFYQHTLGIGNVPFKLSIRELSAVGSILWLIPVMVIGVTSFPTRVVNSLFEGGNLRRGIRLIWSTALLVSCFLLILGQSYNPFLYFRF